MTVNAVASGTSGRQRADRTAPSGEHPGCRHAIESAELFALMEGCVGAAVFRERVFSRVAEGGMFPGACAALESLRDSEADMSRCLRDLLGEQRGGMPDDSTGRADEYAAQICRLGWEEFVTAAVCFAEAALWRLYCLKSMAPAAMRSSLPALIEHQKKLVEVAGHLRFQRCG